LSNRVPRIEATFTLNAPKFRPKAGVNALETCFWGTHAVVFVIIIYIWYGLSTADNG